MFNPVSYIPHLSSRKFEFNEIVFVFENAKIIPCCVFAQGNQHLTIYTLDFNWDKPIPRDKVSSPIDWRNVLGGDCDNINYGLIHIYTNNPFLLKIEDVMHLKNEHSNGSDIAKWLKSDFTHKYSEYADQYRSLWISAIEAIPINEVLAHAQSHQ